MTGFLNRWRRSWRQSPGACLVFGVLCIGYVAVPIGIGLTVLVVSIWFAPDLWPPRLFEWLELFCLILLPWFGLRLTGWLNCRWLSFRQRLGLA